MSTPSHGRASFTRRASPSRRCSPTPTTSASTPKRSPSPASRSGTSPRHSPIWRSSMRPSPSTASSTWTHPPLRGVSPPFLSSEERPRMRRLPQPTQPSPLPVQQAEAHENGGRSVHEASSSRPLGRGCPFPPSYVRLHPVGVRYNVMNRVYFHLGLEHFRLRVLGAQ